MLSGLVALGWTSWARAETVRVHVVSPVPVQIEAQLGSRWETVCTSPCDVDLPAGQLVRVHRRGPPTFGADDDLRGCG